MQLRKDTIISEEKIRDYLLTPRKRNDKSQWLAMAGYTLDNWKILKNDLRNQILIHEATLIEQNKYGQMYEIRSRLLGPNKKILTVCTIWMKEPETGITKFITMFPDKRGDLP